ncbi:MAG TPA: 16S rRNA (guanine(527)-N(7))-methyltransferase RsmG [Flavobacteriales bacterium]|jgi:16S rRNA (guanine527-N7)-methyltransferase|nr:16S rRNA (guanine(527)-N(7))-methyltransferase RsmG [Flavobacteriales bacterium]
MKELHDYFPELSVEQKILFDRIPEVYKDWNQKINVVSRKDVEDIEIRHVIHSLAIARIFEFLPGQKVLDIGTGGGFPGIPLAILFPDTKFLLVDSIGKKIRVVQDVILQLGLNNVNAIQSRAEELDFEFDTVICRAVAPLSTLWYWIGNKIKNESGFPANGLIALKGGDLHEEIKTLGLKAEVFKISSFYKEPFFETKKVVFVPK